MIFAAYKLIEIGANNVLIKGGHLASNNVQDIFVSKSDIKFLIVRDIILKILMEQVAPYLVQSPLFYHVENL